MSETSQFRALVDAAEAGDLEAVSKLPAAGEAYLAAAGTSWASDSLAVLIEFSNMVLLRRARANNPDFHLEFSRRLLAMHDAWKAAVSGFTQEDVDRLRKAQGVDEQGTAQLRDLADRLAERLPPGGPE